MGGDTSSNNTIGTSSKCYQHQQRIQQHQALMKQKLQQQSLLQHQTTTISSIGTATATAMLVYVWIKCVNGF
jgi:hypothetical protein